MRKHKAMETEPLLYIVQPKPVRVTAHMQETFTWTSRTEKTAIGAIDEQDETREETKAFLSKKEFQAMPLDEQLVFLTKLPGHLPPLKCQFVTQEQSYEGVLKRCTADELVIADERGNETVIGRAGLVSVTMIGFVP